MIYVNSFSLAFIVISNCLLYLNILINNIFLA
uniref:7TM_GPCR_Srx domain-containing protein n=1 Tax=Heterorhabditis bacteriophora TaxID=37862 RepID=A0A1I7WJH7_HETBA